MFARAFASAARSPVRSALPRSREWRSSARPVARGASRSETAGQAHAPAPPTRVALPGRLPPLVPTSSASRQSPRSQLTRALQPSASARRLASPARSATRMVSSSRATARSYRPSRDVRPRSQQERTRSLDFRRERARALGPATAPPMRTRRGAPPHRLLRARRRTTAVRGRRPDHRNEVPARSGTRPSPSSRHADPGTESEIHSATRRWRSRRSTRGSDAYATSCVSACLNANSRLPENDGSDCSKTSPRLPSPARTSSSISTAEGQKLRPMTEHRRRASRSAASSRSMRAAMTP